jgi:hypothetical protein
MPNAWLEGNLSDLRSHRQITGKKGYVQLASGTLWTNALI